MARSHKISESELFILEGLYKRFSYHPKSKISHTNSMRSAIEHGWEAVFFEKTFSYKSVKFHSCIHYPHLIRFLDIPFSEINSIFVGDMETWWPQVVSFSTSNLLLQNKLK